MMAGYLEYHDDSSSDSDLSFSDSDNDSHHSRETQFTATTNYSPRPSITDGTEVQRKLDFHQKDAFRDSAACFASYTSSLESLDDIEYDDTDDYELAPPEQEVYHSDAIPSTPQDFAELFPSDRKLLIAHDDATIDGNMNLRIDTLVEDSKGETKKMTLYHLKMNDLKTRKCSLRRHCRDSGREICHSHVKNQALDLEVKNKFSVARSISDALSFRSKTSVDKLQADGIRRQDSGYGSIHGEDNENPKSHSSIRTVSTYGAEDIVSLEFSNYAHLDVKRQGFGSEKRYDFEYWGVNYSWQRTALHRNVTYNLVRHKDHALVAQISPISLTDAEAQDEIEQGGWIPPCSMRVVDRLVLDASGDVADVIVATGLMTLVDDSVRRRFHSKSVKQLVLPAVATLSSPKRLNFITPKRLIDVAFGRSKRMNIAS